MSEIGRWWMLVHKIPPEPSSARVAVWRKLRAHGAVSLQQTVWVLPHEPKHHQFFLDIQAEIAAASGTARVMRVEVEDDPGAIVEHFTADRDAEYAEFGERCKNFLDELAKETRLEKYSFAELTELEGDFEKMQQWLAKIHARDFYAASGRAEAGAKLAECDEALRAFSDTVYRKEGVHGRDSAHPEGSN